MKTSYCPTGSLLVTQGEKPKLKFLNTHDRMIPMMKTMNVRGWIPPFVLALVTAACRPVLTIGWGEIGIIIVLVILFLGPAIFSIYRKVGEFRKWNQKKSGEDDQKSVELTLPSRYPFPWKTGFQILLDALFLRSRSFREDAQTTESLLSQPPRIINKKNIPNQGPCLLVMNHYSQPDFGAWWIALSITNAVRVDIHWLMTAAWTFPDQPILKFLIPVTYWLFTRVAGIYGFTNMPPMPPDPNQTQNRAGAVRLALRYASTSQDPVIALAPEGRDYPGGILGMPPPGVGRFIAKLVKHCQKITPIGVYEEDNRLCLCFGEAFSIDLNEGISKDTLDASVSRQVMGAIARQLPSNLQGDYNSI